MFYSLKNEEEKKKKKKKKKKKEKEYVTILLFVFCFIISVVHNPLCTPQLYCILHKTCQKSNNIDTFFILRVLVSIC